MFIAKISRGRTIRQFINATMTAPIIYSFLWFSIFGSAGLKMERDAESGCCNATGKLVRLSTRKTEEMWFDVMDQQGDLGMFLSIVSLVSIVLYFVTSSDSGSLVIDCLSANGDAEPPVIQRVFWALTEGACATALLYSGGTNGLQALQAVSIASGVPYTIMLCFMCVALWRAVKIEAGDLDPHGPHFSTGLLDVLTQPTMSSVQKVLIAIVAPWYSMGNAASKFAGREDRKYLYMLALAAPFYLWIVCMALEPVVQGISYVGWTILIGFFAYATAIRNSIREKYAIYGNMTEDFFAVTLTYFFAAYQMEHHMDHVEHFDMDGTNLNGVSRDIMLSEVHINKMAEDNDGTKPKKIDCKTNGFGSDDHVNDNAGNEMLTEVKSSQDKGYDEAF